ncbi:unnamed protein product [Staurois parvus]|uniref:Uncharacterized protein n=1 Tax=Staurois parvus TaxID=386267 RepID=A0ABN9CE20_9NEOB|nr:unnamed protein product [Staurois parvus]
MQKNSGITLYINLMQPQGISLILLKHRKYSRKSARLFHFLRI